MDEYIERETIKAAMIHYGFKSPDMTVTEFIEDELPAADVAPVVRCRECKHCDPENYHCDHPMGTAAPLRRKPDDFCSYGDRKEGADNG